MAGQDDTPGFAGEGQTVQDGDGTMYVVRGGQLIPQGNPQSLSGDAKAVGSGLLHEALPGIVGAPGDVAKAAGQVRDWWTGLQPQEGAKMPEVQGEGVTAKSTAPAEGSSSLPTSETVKNYITSKIPEYQPKNDTERALKSFGAFAPAAVGAPEGLGAEAAYGALPLTRYGVAPAVASAGAGAAADYLSPGNQYTPYLQTAAALAAPLAAGKAITPFPVSPEAATTAELLRGRGVDLTPGQFGADNSRMAADAKLANSWGSGTSAPEINAVTRQQLTRGALRTAFGDMSDPVINESLSAQQGVQRAGQNIDNEFTRLTSTYGLPYSNQMKNGMQNAIDAYKQNHLTGDAKELEDYKDRLEQQIAPQGDILNGRQYQNERSALSNKSADAGDPGLSRAYGQMRDALDQGMRDRIQFNVNSGHAPPNEVDAFDRTRQAYQSNMIMQRAANGVKASASDSIDPQALANATKQVIGNSWQNHPLGQYALTALSHGKPLPNPDVGHSAKELLNLGGVVGGGDAGSLLAHGIAAAAGGAAGNSALHGGEGAMIGALTPAALALGSNLLGGVKGRVVHSDLLRPYILNQWLPQSARGVTKNTPSEALLAAGALANKRDQPEGQ